MFDTFLVAVIVVLIGVFGVWFVKQQNEINKNNQWLDASLTIPKKSE